MTIIPIVVDGKSYRKAPRPVADEVCSGCVAHGSSKLCHDLPNCWDSSRGATGHIYIAVPEALPARNLQGIPIVDTKAAFDNGYAQGMAAKQAEWTRFEVQRAATTAEYITRPLARSLDPLTSKQAARDMNRKAGRIADLVLLTLRDCNQTGKQLAAATGVPLNSITPRFAQLSRRGLIHAAGGAGRETVWALGNGVAAAPSVSPSLFESA